MWPCYLDAYQSGRLEEKVADALALLAEPCRVCPRACRVNRSADERAVCRTGRRAVVASAFAHLGEEACLTGSRGSGTIFFSHCNLKCVFCQNYDISHEGRGVEIGPEALAGLMLQLQEAGCHNINFVTPEHVVPQITEALPLAIAGGLRLPLVYNTSAFDSPESLAVLDGLVDIYMPDFKFWDPDASRRYLGAVRYPEAARHALLEMHRQVGDLVIGPDGVARRGLLVRHLVMPGEVAGTRQILRFLAREVSPDTFLNLMDQYRPAGRSHRYPEIHRRLAPGEFGAALQAAREEGLHRFDNP